MGACVCMCVGVNKGWQIGMRLRLRSSTTTLVLRPSTTTLGTCQYAHSQNACTHLCLKVCHLFSAGARLRQRALLVLAHARDADALAEVGKHAVGDLGVFAI